MCTPIINNYWNPECSEEEARQIIIQCFRNLFYRDSRASDKIQISTVNQNGATIGKPI
jgi:20S proteasome alpha/beta subunit